MTVYTYLRAGLFTAITPRYCLMTGAHPVPNVKERILKVCGLFFRPLCLVFFQASKPPTFTFGLFSFYFFQEFTQSILVNEGFLQAFDFALQPFPFGVTLFAFHFAELWLDFPCYRVTVKINLQFHISFIRLIDDVANIKRKKYMMQIFLNKNVSFFLNLLKINEKNLRLILVCWFDRWFVGKLVCW